MGQLLGRQKRQRQDVVVKGVELEQPHKVMMGQLLQNYLMIYDNESNELMVEIEVNDGTSMFGRTIFRGTFNEFIEKLR